MGTNYYRHDWYGNRTHLTKTSCGWVPPIHTNDNYHSWEGFKRYIRETGCIIKDEYGRVVEAEELINKLTRFRDSNDRRHQRRDYEDEGFDFVSGDWC